MKLCITVTGILIALNVVASETENPYMKSIRKYADAVLAKDSEKIEQAEVAIEKIQYEEKRRISDIMTTNSSLLRKRNTNSESLGIRTIDCNNDTAFLEKEFLNHVDEGKSPQNSVIATWSVDQQKTLCIRALNDSRQFSFGFSTMLLTESVLFNHYSHESVKLKVLECPADNTFIYESRRQRDCYLVLSRKKFGGTRPVGYLYIQYERCGLGLMSNT